MSNRLWLCFVVAWFFIGCGFGFNVCCLWQITKQLNEIEQDLARTAEAMK